MTKIFYSNKDQSFKRRPIRKQETPMLYLNATPKWCEKRVREIIFSTKRNYNQSLCGFRTQEHIGDSQIALVFFSQRKCTYLVLAPIYDMAVFRRQIKEHLVYFSFDNEPNKKKLFYTQSNIYYAKYSCRIKFFLVLDS